MTPLATRPHAARTGELLRFSLTPRRLRAHSHLAVGLAPALVAMVTLGVAYWALGHATAGDAPLQALQSLWWTRLFMTLSLSALLLGWTIARLARGRGSYVSRTSQLRAGGFTLLIGALDAIAVTAFVAGARVAGIAPVASGASLSVGVAAALGAIAFGERPATRVIGGKWDSIPRCAPGV
jgi:hypothetical protein